MKMSHTYSVPPRLMGTIGIFRLIAGSLGMVFLYTHSSLSVSNQTLQILLIGYGLLTITLTMLWMLKSSTRLTIQGVLWGCDALMAAFLLIKFSQPTTAAPALLPVLAYEAEAYWSRIGSFLGSLATAFLLTLTWWLRLWSHRSTFSELSLLFWFGTLFLLTTFPTIVKHLSAAPPDLVASSPSSKVETDTIPLPSVSTLAPVLSEKIVVSANLSQLTKREAEIYRLMQSHRSLRQIARDLHIDYSTAKTHARHITHKMTHPATELEKEKKNPD